MITAIVFLKAEVARRRGKLTPRGDLLDRLQMQVAAGAVGHRAGPVDDSCP